MNKPSKTMFRLLREARENGGRAGYGGDREATAARRLMELGAVTMHPVDGWYLRRSRQGHSVRGYHSQGSIRIA